MLRATLLPLLSLLLLPTSITATFIACITPGGAPRVLTSIPIPTQAQNNADGCGALCQADGYAYSYWGLYTGCDCSDTAPSTGTTTVQANTLGLNTDCPSSGNIYSVHYLLSNYLFYGCYNAISYGTGTSNSAPDAATCLARCAAQGSYTAAVGFGTSFSANLVECACSIGGSGPVLLEQFNTVCGVGTFDLFTAQPGPSHTVKRNERIVKGLEAKRKRDEVCPAGLTACLVGDADGAFECVDVEEELESCGGCVGGYYDATSVNVTAIGTDCTALPGVAPDGVMCVGGSCKVLRCDDAFQLVGHGKCTPLLRQQRSQLLPRGVEEEQEEEKRQ